jgi:adenylate cyclase
MTVSEHLNQLNQFIFEHQKLAYAVVDQELNLIQTGGNASLLNVNFEATTIFDLAPELYGCEEVITELLENSTADFCLSNLNRQLEHDEVHYVDLILLPYQKHYLLLLLVDKTEWSRTQQILTQQRNELNLLKNQLDAVNKRMEFIIQHYVPREVGKALMENKINTDLGGEVREITALFADLRNYTSLSEKYTPDELIDLLHICLEIAATAVEKHGGVVVNFMGDAIMAIFNAPNPKADHAALAVQAGIAMQEGMKKYLINNNGSELFLGVGINTGKALVGNIGVDWHYQYTAVGDTINVASRICGHARPEEVLIGPSTYEYIKNTFQTKTLPAIKFKGKSAEMNVYSIIM